PARQCRCIAHDLGVGSEVLTPTFGQLFRLLGIAIGLPYETLGFGLQPGDLALTEEKRLARAFRRALVTIDGFLKLGLELADDLFGRIEIAEDFIGNEFTRAKGELGAV